MMEPMTESGTDQSIEIEAATGLELSSKCRSSQCQQQSVPAAVCASSSQFSKSCNPYRMRPLRLLSVLLLLCPLWLSAERNEEEEAICQPFLTSRESSPLLSIADLPRDLKRDEDGEFSCELVLQDPDLPGQIRVTIHEGLFYLALRHVQMGLKKHKRAAHHARQLAALLPAKHSFSFKAGFWSLDAHVDQAGKAVEYLHSCVHGRASNDSTIAPSDRTEARREYVRALVHAERFVDAAVEVEALLAANPADFYLAFQLRSLRQLAGGLATIVSVAELQSRELYTEMRRHFTSAYTGFTPPAGGAWSPRRLVTLPSKGDFNEHYANREPFVVSLGLGIDAALEWGTAKWSREYLAQAMGEEELWVEAQAAQQQSFGLGPAVRRQQMVFRTFIDRLENATTLYLNTQKEGSGEGVYRPPLHRVKDDIRSHPPFLPDSILGQDIIDINLWMGGSATNPNPSTSRLHADPADNIYIVLQGRKNFTIFSPDLASDMQTVGPAFAVARNGHSFFLKPPSLADLHGLNIVPNDTTAGATAEPPNPNLKWYFTAQAGTAIDTSNYHFSEIADPLAEPSIAERAISFSLGPGDMLYLPCGWFHTVTSLPGEHMALNYWFKPPGWQTATEVERLAAVDVFWKMYSPQPRRAGEEL